MGCIISFGSLQPEMSFFSTYLSVMWWYTTSQKILHNSRLKKQHGPSQVRSWDMQIIWHCRTDNHMKNKFCCLFLTPLIFSFFLSRTALHEEMENFKSRKMFILISTVMTWAMTKPQDPVRLKKDKGKPQLVRFQNSNQHVHNFFCSGWQRRSDIRGRLQKTEASPQFQKPHRSGKPCAQIGRKGRC